MLALIVPTAELKLMDMLFKCHEFTLRNGGANGWQDISLRSKIHQANGATRGTCQSMFSTDHATA